MEYVIETIKRLFLEVIQFVEGSPEIYAKNPGVDFSRNRKLTFRTLIQMLLVQGGEKIEAEICKYFRVDSFNMDVKSLPTPQAFCQARRKLRLEALELIYTEFTKRLFSYLTKNRKGLLMFAADGTDVRIGYNKEDKDSVVQQENAKPYNLLHINAMMSVDYNIFTNIIIQANKAKNETGALLQMVMQQDFPKNSLITVDRGYDSLNLIWHFLEKGIFFLIRVKNGGPGVISSLDLPDTGEFDESVNLFVTRQDTEKTRKMCRDNPKKYRIVNKNSCCDFLSKYDNCEDGEEFHKISFRVARFKLDESKEEYETVVTNLPSEEYSSEDLMELYFKRWQIETGFRSLKYSTALSRFHSKNIELVKQEIYAKFTMFNFVAAITGMLDIMREEEEKKKEENNKYFYKVSFSDMVDHCRSYFLGYTGLGNILPLAKRVLIAVRLDRKFPRLKCLRRPESCFNYRIV